MNTLRRLVEDVRSLTRRSFMHVKQADLEPLINELSAETPKWERLATEACTVLAERDVNGEVADKYWEQLRAALDGVKS